MDINAVKNYLDTLPIVQDIPVDEELEKFITLAELLLDIYYSITDDFKTKEEYVKIITLETAHLIENTPYEDVYKQYNYLSSFNVAGAISGTVKEKYIAYISDIVKSFLSKYRF